MSVAAIISPLAAAFCNPVLYQHLDGTDVRWFPALFPLAGVGLAVGFVAGMFGIGGGFILTPVLNIVFGVPMPLAVSSSLCQQCGTTFSSYLRFRRYHFGDPRIACVMLGGALLGTDAGTRLLVWLNSLGLCSFGAHPPIAAVVLEVLYSAVLILTIGLSIREAIAASKRTVPRGDVSVPGPLARIRIPPYMDLPGVGLQRVSVPVLAYVGFLVGLLSGLMGIGGGVAFVPILLYGYGLSIRNTAGSSLLLLFGIVITGTITHAARGNMSLSLAMAVLIGSSVGAQLGALTTARLANRFLRWGFIALLAGTISLILVDLFRHLR